MFVSTYTVIVWSRYLHGNIIKHTQTHVVREQISIKHSHTYTSARAHMDEDLFGEGDSEGYEAFRITKGNCTI